MNDQELKELASLLTKRAQTYFWLPERRGERTKITRIFNILKDLQYCGYEIIKK